MSLLWPLKSCVCHAAGEKHNYRVLCMERGGSLQLLPSFTCRLVLHRLWDTKLQCSLAQHPLDGHQEQMPPHGRRSRHSVQESCAQHDALLAVL